MDKDKIGGWIAHHEGVREQVYLDSADSPNPTIGIGFNLNREDAPELIQNLGLDYDKVINGEQSLSQEQINHLFKHDLDVAINDARNTFSNFDELPEDKQLVLVDMSFNLGQSKLSGFENMIDAVEKEDWQKAADEMVDSKWYDDVNDRGVHNVDVMRSGFNETHENYVSNYVDFSTADTEGVTTNDSSFTIIENPDVKDPLLETFNIPSPFDILTEPTNEFPPPIVDNQGNEWNTQLNDPWAENTTSQEPINDIWATETKSAWESDPINPSPTDDWNAPANDIWGSSNPSNQDPVNESWNTPTNTDIWANQTTVENSVNDRNSPNNDTWANDTINQTPSNDSWSAPNNDSWANDSSSQSSSNDSSSDT